MTDTLPADHRIGSNKPPLDEPGALPARLDRDGAELIDRACDLDSETIELPERIETEADAARVTEAAAKVGKLLGDIDKFRQAEKAPYLDGCRTVDKWAGDLAGPLERLTDKKSHASLIGRLNVWQAALRAKAEAERRAREAEERQRREEEAAKAKAAAAAAAQAEREEREAAEAIRAATDAKSREAAAQAMRDAAANAAEQRAAAEAATKAAATSQRLADTLADSARGDRTASRVTAGGASASSTRYWSHRIDDADALMKSLGPLGAYLSNDAISQGLTAVQRALPPAGGAEPPNIAIPGVTFFRDFRTNISQKRN